MSSRRKKCNSCGKIKKLDKSLCLECRRAKRVTRQGGEVVIKSPDGGLMYEAVR